MLVMKLPVARERSLPFSLQFFLNVICLAKSIGHWNCPLHTYSISGQLTAYYQKVFGHDTWEFIFT